MTHLADAPQPPVPPGHGSPPRSVWSRFSPRPAPAPNGRANQPTVPGGAPAAPKNPMRSRRWWITFLAILLVNYLVISLFLPGQPEPLDLPYTTFKQQVEAGNVQEVVSRGEDIQGTFKQPVTDPPSGGEGSRTSREFSTVRPSFADPGLEALLDSKSVTINA